MTVHKYSSAGLTDIILERQHQFDLGYSVAHDAEHHSVEELMRVGSCYIDLAASTLEEMDIDSPHPFWPEGSIPWNPEDTPEGNAVKGAAFIAAALDLLRQQRLEDDAE